MTIKRLIIKNELSVTYCLLVIVGSHFWFHLTIHSTAHNKDKVSRRCRRQTYTYVCCVVSFSICISFSFLLYLSPQFYFSFLPLISSALSPRTPFRFWHMIIMFRNIFLFFIFWHVPLSIVTIVILHDPLYY